MGENKKLKQLIEDILERKSSFEDYSDVVTLDMIAKAQQGLYHEYLNHTLEVANNLREQLPNLDRVHFTKMKDGIILHLAVKDRMYYKRGYFYSTPRIDIIDESGRMEFYNGYFNDYSDIDKKQFLEKYRDYLMALREKICSDPFFDRYKIETMEEVFDNIAFDDNYLSMVTKYDELLDNGLRVSYAYSTGKYNLSSGSGRVKRFLKKDGNLERLADKILIKEANIPVHLQEKVNEQKQLCKKRIF